MSQRKKNTDEIYMQRALELAQLGLGTVSPNPMVGCVVVHEGRIIGEGYHQKYGEAHAEVNAVNSVENKELLKESTAYVTLEPCAHFGKTPPCADLLSSFPVKKVVIASVDTNPLVGGKGIEKLKAAGVEVTSGVLDAENRQLNRRFFTFIEKKRPFVILKWAQTTDGFIAREDLQQTWISNQYSRQLVHEMRAEEDAILVGPNTANHDDPKLNVREVSGNNPIRVLIDRNLSVSNDKNLFDGSQPTLVYNLQKEGKGQNIEWIKLGKENFIEALLNDLHNRKIQSVIIEGGAGILNAFIEDDLWDEARIFIGQTTLEKGVKAPHISLKNVQEKSVMGDMFLVKNNH